MNIVEINKQPVELFKILKFEGIASSGAMAKQIIADGQVKLNGQIETQKRKKIVSGDMIEIDNLLFEVKLIGD